MFSIKRLLKKALRWRGDMAEAGRPAWEPQTLCPLQEERCRLAHVAAFTPQGSNAGDILLPATLRDAVSHQAGGIRWSSFQVRDPVTLETIDKINRSEGLIIGGGGLFLRDTNPNQISGWQWACPTDYLRAIKVPFCAFAVGYNRFRGQDDFDPVFSENLQVLAERAVFIGLRNMGSVNAIRGYLPSELQSKVRFQPCLTTIASRLYPELTNRKSKSKPFIALNCAFDRPELRYQGNKELVLESIALGTRKAAEHLGLDIKYYSHFAADEEMIDVLVKLGVPHKVVDLSQLNSKEIIEAYSRPTLAMGMRGHAQMIPFGCGTPILSLISHNKLQWFLDDIGHADWGVDLHQDHIQERLFDRAVDLINHAEKVRNEIAAATDRLWDVSRENIEVFMDAVSRAKKASS